MAFVDSWETFSVLLKRRGLDVNLFSPISVQVFHHHFLLLPLLELIITAISFAFLISHSVLFETSFQLPLINSYKRTCRTLQI